MNIGIITTLNHNVGDDFVREGICHILNTLVKNPTYSYIHKHVPITVRKELAWLDSCTFRDAFGKRFESRWYDFLNRLDRNLPSISSTDKILKARILIQSGAPVFWKNGGNSCANSEWWNPLIEKRWFKVSDPEKKYLNLAGGTCQDYNSNGCEITTDKNLMDFIKKYITSSNAFTVRDNLSHKIAKEAGIDVPKIPCTSIFARHNLNIESREGEFVVLNYMPGGGHYDFRSEIDASLWEQRFEGFVKVFAKREKCVLVCHNQKEYASAERLFPDIQRFIAGSHADYLKIFSRAKYGIVNRVHAGFAIASFGKPSLIIGADSRARMASEIGLQSVFVNDANTDLLLEHAYRLGNERQEFSEKIEVIKLDAFRSYQNIVAECLKL